MQSICYYFYKFYIKKYKMSCKVKSAKKRISNFSNLEKLKLVEIIEREKNIIENKKTDNISIKDKENCWIDVTREFNSNCISEHRDVNSLKNCWDNLKKKTRKHYAEIRSEIFKTGGGKANITADDPIAERVKTIIQPSVEGLQNRFDSDYIPGIDNSQCSNDEIILENEDFSPIEILEDENLSDVILTEWTPAKLTSENNKLPLSKRKDADELTFGDIEKLFHTQSSGRIHTPVTNNNKVTNYTTNNSMTNDPITNTSATNNSIANNLVTKNPTINNPITNNTVTMNSVTQKPILKRKRSKQLQISAGKRNDRFYDLAESKLELVKMMKEDMRKKSALEISIFELQLEKEKLQIEILKKQLKSYDT